MARRQSVLSDVTLDKESKRPVHIRDVENCTNNAGESLSNNTPRLPLDVAWTECTSGSDFAKKGTNNGVELVRGAS